MTIAVGGTLAANPPAPEPAEVAAPDASGKRTVDFSAYILDNRGHQIPDIGQWPVDPKTGAQKPQAEVDVSKLPALTLGAVVAGVLDAQEKGLTSRDIFLRGELGARVAQGGKLWLTAEEAALIVRLLPNSGSPLVVFRAMRLLGEPDPK